MNVLAVDCSSSTASVAVLSNGKILSDFYVNAGLTHSQTLAPMINLAIKNSSLKINDIDFFAVTDGPGSFTGLRIGMATIKGMSIGANKKCIGVSSLLAAAYHFKDFSGIICSCMDARRGEIYNALFMQKNGILKRVTEDRAISIEKLGLELKNFQDKVILVGDGAEMCYNILSKEYSEKFKLPCEYLRYVNAKSVAFAAVDFYQSQEQSFFAKDLDLRYLRVSQAERMLSEKNNS